MRKKSWTVGLHYNMMMSGKMHLVHVLLHGSFGSFRKQWPAACVVLKPNEIECIVQQIIIVIVLSLNVFLPLT